MTAAKKGPAPRKTFAEIMAANAEPARARRTVKVCLDASVHARYVELEEQRLEAVDDEDQAARAAKNGKPRPTRLAAASASGKLQAEIDALVDDNPDAFYAITLQAARRPEWITAKSQHPPVDGVADDDALGVHWESMVPAVLELCMTDPEPTPETLAFLVDHLSPGELEDLALVGWRISQGVRAVPKSRTHTSATTGSATG